MSSYLDDMLIKFTKKQSSDLGVKDQIEITDSILFKKVAFDKVYTKAQKKNTEDSRTQAKRQQSVVSGGSSSRASVSIPGPIRTVQEAFALAQKILGD